MLSHEHSFFLVIVKSSFLIPISHLRQVTHEGKESSESSGKSNTFRASFKVDS